MKLVYLLTMISILCMSATTSQVNTYINGNTLTADQLNSEFSNIYGTINSLDDANISSSAAIDPSKISSLIGGDGIARQSDGSLDVNVDATTVKIISGQVAISDLPGSAIVAGGVGSTQIANGGVAKIDLAVKTATATASKNPARGPAAEMTICSMGRRLRCEVTLKTSDSGMARPPKA